MKTSKYFILFDMVETEMSTTMEITKAAYNEQIKFLTAQAAKTASEEYPVEAPRTNTFDRNAYITETVTYFSCGCATTTLIKQECKPGYHFKPKK